MAYTWPGEMLSDESWKTLLNKIIENKACLRHHFLSQACFNILSGNQ